LHSTSASIKIFITELLEGNVPDSDDEIRVTDKRKFDKEGNIKETASADERKVKAKTSKTESAHSQPSSNEAESKPNKEVKNRDESKQKQQAIEFIPFVLSLYTSILASLGELPDTSGIKVEKNVAQAKELIDIIKMLSNKTKGNLSEDEQNVIEEVIYQSEMIYIKNVSDLKI
jgi:hypothetical protein